MTTCAWCGDMCTGQLETGRVVIESGRLPGAGRVTCAAIWAEMSLMRIVLGMTCCAGAGSVLE
jgi:hypothetical protein